MHHGQHVHDRHRDHPHTCRICGERPALARAGGRCVVTRGHDLCARCWRALLDRAHGERLAQRHPLEAGEVQAA